MAGVLRLLDTGSLRVGTEAYAAEHETYGVATLLRKHVRVGGSRIELAYTGKGGISQHHAFTDPPLARLLSDLLSRDDRGPELFAWRDDDSWRDVRSADINTHIKTVMREDLSAKDFRTWNATVLMAQVLATFPEPESTAASNRAISAAYSTVANYLGNTPTIARTSYVNSRVVDLYRDGVVLPPRVLPRTRRELPVHGQTERAVLRMLKHD